VVRLFRRAKKKIPTYLRVAGFFHRFRFFNNFRNRIVRIRQFSIVKNIYAVFRRDVCNFRFFLYRGLFRSKKNEKWMI
jgi:hypothetical protein